MNKISLHFKDHSPIALLELDGKNAADLNLFSGSILEALLKTASNVTLPDNKVWSGDFLLELLNKSIASLDSIEELDYEKGEQISLEDEAMDFWSKNFAGKKFISKANSNELSAELFLNAVGDILATVEEFLFLRIVYIVAKTAVSLGIENIVLEENLKYPRFKEFAAQHLTNLGLVVGH